MKPESPSFELSANSVHLWYVPLDIDAKTRIKYWKILSVDEQVKANRFKFNSDKIKYIACRGVLRMLLGQYLENDPARIKISYIKNGKPNHNSNLEFNVSHSKDWAVIGFTLDNILGVDIEYTKRIIEFEDIASRFFSPAESDLVCSAAKDKLPIYFYNCWTRKEAFIKAIGDGLSFPLDQFEVSCKPDDVAQLLNTSWDYTEVEKWALWSFNRNRDYVGAVALRGPKKELSIFSWEHNFYD